MRVLHIINKTPVIQEVPDDYLLCSISGEFRPRIEFCNSEGVYCRTNCTGTYMMTCNEMSTLETEISAIKKSHKYGELLTLLCKEQVYYAGSISIDSIISDLLELKAKDPGARIVITQAGYYCEGVCADIYSPELVQKLNNINYYSIGNSTQNY